MTPSPQTNFLYLADCLPKKHPAFYQHFTTALNQQDIPFALLPGTKDIWAVDYMPIQTAINRFIRFTYNPSYLQSKKYQSTISDTDSICKAIQIETITSTIILDGGNLIRSNNKAILTNRIFSENPAMDKQQLIRELQELLSIENIYIIPSQPYDFTGHADGMVRFLDEHTLLINDYGHESQSFQKAFNKAIEQTGLETVKIPNEVYHNKSKDQANGCYINYLHINNRIFLPIYNTPTDEQTISQFEELFPGHAIVPIECNEIANEGGVLNCISWNILK